MSPIWHVRAWRKGRASAAWGERMAEDRSNKREEFKRGIEMNDDFYYGIRILHWPFDEVDDDRAPYTYAETLEDVVTTIEPWLKPGSRIKVVIGVEEGEK